MKDLIQTQKITLINLNDRNDVQIRIIYYIFGGLIELARDRKATAKEMRDAHGELPTEAKVNRAAAIWKSFIQFNWAIAAWKFLLKALFFAAVAILVLTAAFGITSAIYFMVTKPF